VWTTQQHVGKLLATIRTCLYSHQLLPNSLPTCYYVVHTRQFEFATTSWPTLVWRVKYTDRNISLLHIYIPQFLSQHFYFRTWFLKTVRLLFRIFSKSNSVDKFRWKASPLDRCRTAWHANKEYVISSLWNNMKFCIGNLTRTHLIEKKKAHVSCVSGDRYQVSKSSIPFSCHFPL